MTKPGIMFFAAGDGTRMRPLTLDRPKPLVSVAGKPLLDHALALTRGAALGPRVINARYLAPMIVDAAAERDLTVSGEDTPIDTGGGLRHALPLLQTNPVVTLNTDAVWSDTSALSQLLSAWQPGMEGLLLVVPPERAIGHLGRGDFLLDAEGLLTRGPGHIYTGLQIIRTDRLHDIPDDSFSLNRVWDRMLAAGTLHGVVYSGKWCDVGQPDSIPLAETLLADAHV